MPLKDLLPNARPREKLLARGAGALSDIELLALLLRTGIKGMGVLFLDVQNRLLAMEELFRGTLTQTRVYLREVMLRALHHQAAAMVLAHNYSSGTVQPSRAEEALTQTLKATLALIDHVIVAPSEALSMAEQGLL